MARDCVNFPPYMAGEESPHRFMDKLLLMVLAAMVDGNGTCESQLSIIAHRALVHPHELIAPLARLRDIGLIRTTPINAGKGTFLFEVFPT